MTKRLVGLCALSLLFNSAPAWGQVPSILPKFSIVAGTAPMEIERFLDGASTGKDSESGFVLGVQAALELPATGVVVGARYLRTIGSVTTQGNSVDSSFDWGFGANELGGFFEYQKSLAPASPANLSLGVGGSLSRLSLTDNVEFGSSGIADIEGNTTVVRLYAVGQASLASSLNVRLMAGAVVSGKLDPPDLQTPDTTFTTENDELVTYGANYRGPFVALAIGIGLI